MTYEPNRVSYSYSGPNTGETITVDDRGNRYSTGPYDVPGYPRGRIVADKDGAFSGRVENKP